MCGAPAFMAISAAIAAGSAIYGGAQQAKAADYQAAVARENQKEANRVADLALQQGASDAARVRERAYRIQAAQKAALAAGNVDVQTGSALDTLVSTEQMGDLDAMTVMNNAFRAARGYRVQGLGFAAQAQLLGMESSAAMTGGLLKAGGSLLGGAAGTYKSGLDAGWWGAGDSTVAGGDWTAGPGATAGGMNYVP